jgi:hypothetical protein
MDPRRADTEDVASSSSSCGLTRRRAACHNAPPCATYDGRCICGDEFSLLCLHFHSLYAAFPTLLVDLDLTILTLIWVLLAVMLVIAAVTAIAG